MQSIQFTFRIHSQCQYLVYVTLSERLIPVPLLEERRA